MLLDKNPHRQVPTSSVQGTGCDWPLTSLCKIVHNNYCLKTHMITFYRQHLKASLFTSLLHQQYVGLFSQSRHRVQEGFKKTKKKTKSELGPLIVQYAKWASKLQLTRDVGALDWPVVGSCVLTKRGSMRRVWIFSAVSTKTLNQERSEKKKQEAGECIK